MPEIEQHRQQVCIVHDAVFVDVLVAGVARAWRAEREQHLQQVGVANASIAVGIICASGVQQEHFALPCL